MSDHSVRWRKEGGFEPLNSLSSWVGASRLYPPTIVGWIADSGDVCPHGRTHIGSVVVSGSLNPDTMSIGLPRDTPTAICECFFARSPDHTEEKR
jgi:hypothetical protein